mgnify:CR=1 FL=1
MRASAALLMRTNEAQAVLKQFSTAVSNSDVKMSKLGLSRHTAQESRLLLLLGGRNRYGNPVWTGGQLKGQRIARREALPQF